MTPARSVPHRSRPGLPMVPLVAAIITLVTGSALAQGSATHVEFSATHAELVGGTTVVSSDSNAGLDGTTQVDDTGSIAATFGTHSIDVSAEVGIQTNGAPVLRARGEHQYDLSGTDLGTDRWSSVDSTALVTATVTEEITLTNAPATPFTVEIYWDVHGTDRARIDLSPGESLYYDFETQVRLITTVTAPNSGGSSWSETVPWPGGYLNTDLDQTKEVSDYVVTVADVAPGTTLSFETTFEVEPDTSLNNAIEGFGMSLVVTGEHTAAFDQSAALIGVIVRDDQGIIDDDVVLTSSTGYQYPVLIEEPIEPLPDRTILSPVAVEDSDLGELASTPYENQINQSGLDKPFISGVTGFDYYFDFGIAPWADAAFANNWQGDAQFTLPVTGYIDFDLGGTYYIDRLAIWNRSLEDIRVQVSDSPAGPWQEVGQFTLSNRLYYSFSYPVEVLDLGGEHEADYVRIAVDSAYKYSVSDTFASPAAGEVALSVALQPAPEPGAAQLGVSGLVGLMLLARRRSRRRRAGAVQLSRTGLA